MMKEIRKNTLHFRTLFLIFSAFHGNFFNRICFPRSPSIQYSILPLLYVLLGGAGTVLGPFLGTLLMFYLIDLSSAVTDAHLMVVGVALLALVLFAPRGLLGALRARLVPWLP